MGQMEVESRKRTKRNDLRKLILQTVQVAGVMSIALMAPNVLTGMKKLGMLPSGRQEDVIRRASRRMIDTGIMGWSDGKLRLTVKGEKLLRTYELRDFKFKKPRRWDKKWRVLIFDIPESRKHLRQKIRIVLRAIGFERLQDSVWVFPYDCEEIVLMLKADFHIGDDVLYMIVDTLERDGDLRRHFNLV